MIRAGLRSALRWRAGLRVPDRPWRRAAPRQQDRAAALRVSACRAGRGIARRPPHRLPAAAACRAVAIVRDRSTGRRSRRRKAPARRSRRAPSRPATAAMASPTLPAAGASRPGRRQGSRGRARRRRRAPRPGRRVVLREDADAGRRSPARHRRGSAAGSSMPRKRASARGASSSPSPRPMLNQPSPSAMRVGRAVAGPCRACDGDAP